MEISAASVDLTATNAITALLVGARAAIVVSLVFIAIITVATVAISFDARSKALAAVGVGLCLFFATVVVLLFFGVSILITSGTLEGLGSWRWLFYIIGYLVAQSFLGFGFNLRNLRRMLHS